MGTQKRFTLFFSLVFILLLASILSSYLLYKKRQCVHQQNEYLQKEYNADIAIKIQSKLMSKFTLDYSLWDEMLKFINHPNAIWAKDNINPLLQTTGFNYIWIYNPSGEKIYELKDPHALAIPDPIPVKSIHRVLDSTTKNCSFFSKNNNQIIEISGGAVHSTSDLKRQRTAGGYFFIGRIIRKDYLNELGIITNSQIDLLYSTNHKNTCGSQKIIIYKDLHGWDNKALATLMFSCDDKFMRDEDYYNFCSIVVYSIVMGLFLTGSFFLIKRRITNPLKAISDCLNTEDRSKIEHLFDNTDEFGQISRLINNSFDQKISLENDYRVLIEHTNSLVCEINDKGILSFLSPSSLKILGYEPAELIGKPVLDLVSGKDKDRLSQYLTRQSPCSNVRDICHFRHKNGAWLWLEFSATYYEQEPGYIRIIAIVTDITVLKQAEDALQKSEDENHALLDAIPDLFFKIRKDGVILSFKAPDEALLYAAPKDFLGKNVKDILPAEVTSNLLDNMEKSIQTNTVCTFEYDLPMNDGLHYYEARIVTFSSAEFFVIIRDITERKQAEIALKENEKQLSELNQTKDKFFSIIAHDLKGPLSSLLGLIEHIIENFGELETRNIKKYLQLIHKSSQNSYKLLENLLDWSRSQTGRIEYKPVVINLKTIINENIATIREQAVEKNIKLNAIINDNYSIFGDRQMINSILRNLLVNAIKFTPHNGKINISVSEKIDHFEISVKDNGVGIPKNELKKLFRLDFKYSTPGTDNEQGTGLGLILCKEFVEKNGGQIWVKSELNQGSEFKFTLSKIGVSNLS